MESGDAGRLRPRATRLHILCRGATLSNRHPRLFSDEPLLPGQVPRIARLAKVLPAFDAVLTAPEASAAETAAFFSPDPLPCAALADTDHGRWQGKALDALRAEDPETFALWMADPSAAPHGGESLAEVQARAALWLEGMHGAGGCRLAVTHAVLLRVLLAHVLAAPLASLARIDVEPLCRLALTSDGRRWALRGFGVVD